MKQVWKMLFALIVIFLMLIFPFICSIDKSSMERNYDFKVK
jgi:hypothetical protein